MSIFLVIPVKDSVIGGFLFFKEEEKIKKKKNNKNCVQNEELNGEIFLFNISKFMYATSYSLNAKVIKINERRRKKKMEKK